MLLFSTKVINNVFRMFLSIIYLSYLSYRSHRIQASSPVNISLSRSIYCNSDPCSRMTDCVSFGVVSSGEKLCDIITRDSKLGGTKRL